MSHKVIRGFEAKTGDLLSQPRSESLRGEAVYSWTPDYSVDFTALGSLDAPQSMPAGGLRRFDGSELSIAWSHVWREGAPA
ncbi:hypothetical protein [Piscinibacter defluvii]|uniref:hypothetical protein n=1 Tax=Piscinibacter defluvii TaxID=1796922 RepID=UPI000FDEF628|nr:hypothetical protein [Piscinibacter defluvii]